MQPTPTIFQKTKSWIINHKFWSTVIVIVIVLIVYFVVKDNKPAAPTTYVIGTATTGTIVATTTGSGQVSSTDQITVPAKTSGQVTSVSVTPGDKVSAGQTLARVDDSTQAISLTQAQNSLAKAKLQLSNDQAAQSLSLTNQQISFNSTTLAQPNQNNQDAITPSISGSYNSTEEGTYTIDDYSCSGGTCINYTGIESGFGLIEPNIPIKLGTRGLYLTYSSVPKIPDTWTVQVPSPLSNNYLSQSQNLVTTQQNNAIQIANDQQSIADAELSLQSAQLNYDDTFIRAPISGTVGQVSIVVGQQVSGTAFTLVGTQQYADIQLNEVDVAKIALGDKATATFDAISGLSIAGHVASIDQVGTVSQGVVNYDVKVAFDTLDARVKSGMSVSVSIATDVQQNIVMVPTSAVKTSGNNSYVLTVPSDTAASTSSTGIELATPPTQTPVTIGISDDTNTQILSGLSDGDKIVTKTVTPSTTATATTTAPSILGSTTGGARAGGGAAAGRSFGGGR